VLDDEAVIFARLTPQPPTPLYKSIAEIVLTAAGDVPDVPWKL
jgi:hypothetical protein